jgi:hypothetical protein
MLWVLAKSVSEHLYQKLRHSGVAERIRWKTISWSSVLFEQRFFPYEGEAVMSEYADGLAPFMLKLKLYLSVPWKFIEGETVEAQFHSLLTLPLDEVSGKPYAAPMLSPGKDPNTHWIGGWLGPTAGLEEFGEEKICCSCLECKPRPSSQ